MEEKRIINSLYEKFYKISEDEDIILSKEVYFDIIFKIVDKIKMARYFNFLYSVRGDKFLNNMDNLDNIFKLYLKEENKTEIFNIFQISKNCSEGFFSIFENIVNKDTDIWYDEFSFLLTETEKRIKFIEIIYYYYFLIFDYFNDYNIYYISNYKSSNKYLYSGIYFENFINKQYSNDTVFYINFSRFISTSYNHKIAEDFYFNFFDNSKIEISKFKKLLFYFDINKIQKYCKFFDFNNDLCVNFEKTKYNTTQQKYKKYYEDYQTKLNKTILLYSIYKTIQPNIDFQTFYKLKENEQISFSKQSYIDMLNDDINFDDLEFKDIDISRIHQDLSDALPYNKSTYRLVKSVYQNKKISCCSLFDEEEVLLLPNEDIFIKIDLSKIKYYKKDYLNTICNVYYIEDTIDNDLFISSSDIIKSLKGGNNNSSNNKNIFVNFSINQLNNLFSNEQIINMYSNNEIIFKKIFDNDIQYKVFKKDFLKLYQDINLKKNNLLKGGNEDYYKQKYLNYKSKYLNLKK